MTPAETALLTDDEAARLRRRLDDLAHEDPVDEAWDTIRRRLEPSPSSRRPGPLPHWRPLVAAVAAIVVILVGLFAFTDREDDSTVDTVDDVTTTTDPDPPERTTTTDAPDSPPSGADPPGPTTSTTAATPGEEARGFQPDSSPTDDPEAAAPDATSRPTTTTTSTTTTSTTSTTQPNPDPQYRMTPTVIAPGETLTVSAVTPCEHATQQEWVGFEITSEDIGHVDALPWAATDDAGTWSLTYEIAADQAAGEYEIWVICGISNPDTGNVDWLFFYDIQTLTVTSAG